MKDRNSPEKVKKRGQEMIELTNRIYSTNLDVCVNPFQTNVVENHFVVNDSLAYDDEAGAIIFIYSW